MWDLVMIVTLLFVAVYTPLRVCFVDSPDPAVSGFDITLDVIFGT
jgi:hypothetical protein